MVKVKEHLSVKGMSCQHCVQHIEEMLAAKDVQATVDLSEQRVTVEFAFEQISLSQIITMIEEEGFDVV